MTEPFPIFFQHARDALPRAFVQRLIDRGLQEAPELDRQNSLCLGRIYNYNRFTVPVQNVG
jgi:hypothetical protein